MPVKTTADSEGASAPFTPAGIDTGLVSLLILARFFGVPADTEQLRHQFGEAGRHLSDTDLLWAAKYLGLKAGFITSTWPHLSKISLPAMAHRKDGQYFILAK